MLNIATFLQTYLCTVKINKTYSTVHYFQEIPSPATNDELSEYTVSSATIDELSEYTVSSATIDDPSDYTRLINYN